MNKILFFKFKDKNRYVEDLIEEGYFDCLVKDKLINAIKDYNEQLELFFNNYSIFNRQIFNDSKNTINYCNISIFNPEKIILNGCYISRKNKIMIPYTEDIVNIKLKKEIV